MNFEEWFGKGEHFYYMESDHRYVSKVSYNAGQRSQQAKIDLLKKELAETQAFLNKQNHIKQAKIDELQARVDEALRFYNEAKSPNNIGMIQMAILLKGNKDEN